MDPTIYTKSSKVPENTEPSQLKWPNPVSCQTRDLSFNEMLTDTLSTIKKVGKKLLDLKKINHFLPIFLLLTFLTDQTFNWLFKMPTTINANFFTAYFFNADFVLNFAAIPLFRHFFFAFQSEKY